MTMQPLPAPAGSLMDPRAPVTVAIASFEDVFARGLESLLGDDPSVAIVARDIVYERLGVVLRAKRPRVLILDVAGLRDLAEVRQLVLEHPRTCLVLFAQELSGAESAQLLAFGARACLAKDTQGRDLLHAVHLAARGMQLVPAGAHDPHEAEVQRSLLTPREGDVLFLLRQNRSNGDIADGLSIGIETVRSHARNIYRKLGVSSRRELVAVPAVAAPAPAAPVEHPVRRRAAPSALPRRTRHR